MATLMYETFAKYHPELRQVNARKWNFLVCSAGFYVASLRLADVMSEGGQAALARLVQDELSDETARAKRSCGAFVNRMAGDVTSRGRFEWAVGAWVLAGLFREKPRRDQQWLAAAIGRTLNDTFGTIHEAAAPAAHPLHKKAG